jgi:hypothetical protein
VSRHDFPLALRLRYWLMWLPMICAGVYAIALIVLGN